MTNLRVRVPAYTKAVGPGPTGGTYTKAAGPGPTGGTLEPGAVNPLHCTRPACLNLTGPLFLLCVCVCVCVWGGYQMVSLAVPV